ncbi:MAG: trypsin-like serine protease [Pseudobdellovibrionaceae bacterium]
MKSRWIISSIFFNLLFWSFSGFAVVQGIEIPTSENSLSPHVSLSFEIKGLLPEPCSATYLGNGKILTAAHCFLLNEYQKTDPQICIQDSVKMQKFCIHSTDYDVYFPPLREEGSKAFTRKTHLVIRLPKPDLAVMVIKEPLRAKLPPFASIPLASLTEAEKGPSSQFKLVGQGCTDYIIPPGELPKGVGVFRSADVILNTVDSDFELTSLWSDKKPNGGVCWGDSGGALMMATPAAPLGWSQIAVVSAMKTKYDPATGKPNLVTSVYTRLDSQEVQDWIQNKILVLP